eukprot:5345892-Pleurochrysis_carterae.AAC.1
MGEGEVRSRGGWKTEARSPQREHVEDPTASEVEGDEGDGVRATGEGLGGETASLAAGAAQDRRGAGDARGADAGGCEGDPPDDEGNRDGRVRVPRVLIAFSGDGTAQSTLASELRRRGRRGGGHRRVHRRPQPRPDATGSGGRGAAARARGALRRRLCRPTRRLFLSCACAAAAKQDGAGGSAARAGALASVRPEAQRVGGILGGPRRGSECGGAAWSIKNPADCGDEKGMAWWPRFRDHAPLWRFSLIRDALAATRAVWETPVRCTDTAVALRACCASARCVPRDFVSDTEWIDESTYKTNCGG